MYEKGRKIHTRYFTAFVLAGRSDRTRIGITVTRKVGKAVERNRCRRLLREAFRKREARAAGTSADIVINVKREMLSAGYAEVEAELMMLLARV